MIELTEPEQLARYLPSAGAHALDKARYGLHVLKTAPSVEALNDIAGTLFGRDYMWSVTAAYKVAHIAVGVPMDPDLRTGLLVDFNETVRHVYDIGGHDGLHAVVSQTKSLPFLEDHGALTLHGVCRWLNISDVLLAYLKVLPDPAIARAITPRILDYARHVTRYDEIFDPFATYLAPKPVRFAAGVHQSWCTTFATPFAAAVRGKGHMTVPTLSADDVEAARGYGEALCACEVLNNMYLLVPWQSRFQVITTIFRQAAQRHSADLTQFEAVVRAFE